MKIEFEKISFRLIFLQNILLPENWDKSVVPKPILPNSNYFPTRQYHKGV